MSCRASWTALTMKMCYSKHWCVEGFKHRHGQTSLIVQEDSIDYPSLDAENTDEEESHYLGKFACLSIRPSWRISVTIQCCF